MKEPVIASSKELGCGCWNPARFNEGECSAGYKRRLSEGSMKEPEETE